MDTGHVPILMFPAGESFWTKMTQTDNLKRKTPLFWKWRDGKAVRLVTAWNTDPSDVDSFLNTVKS